MQSDIARFLALIRRELGARDVSVLELGEPTSSSESPLILRCTLPDGRILVAAYDEPPVDRDALQRRLEMLANTCDTVTAGVPDGPRSRPPAGQLLREELRKLCDRGSAINALVIDANSPVLWAAARSRDVAAEAWTAFDPQPVDDSTPPSVADASVARASRKALADVRNLVDLAALRKGKRGRHVEREGEAPFVAHSFAGIYLVVLVFSAPFDELRAERAILESLTRIERLVLALPPLDPTPERGAGVVAIRRPRRR